MSGPVPQTQKCRAAVMIGSQSPVGRDEAAQGRAVVVSRFSLDGDNPHLGDGGLVAYTECGRSRHRQHRPGRSWSFAWARHPGCSPNPALITHPSGSLSSAPNRREGSREPCARYFLSWLLLCSRGPWAVGATVESPTNRQSSPASRLMQWEGLGPPSALFPLSPVQCRLSIVQPTCR